MATITSKHSNRYNVRSISFPARLHPSTERVQAGLNKLKSLEASSTSSMAATICIRLSGLAELYRSIEDLLNLPLTYQALAQNQYEKWINELLDGSVSYLDVCGKTRDAVSSMKESVRVVQSALRRSKGGDWSIEGDVNGYIFSRKKMKKEIAKYLASLKRVDGVIGGSPLLDIDEHLSAIVKVLQEVSLITNSVFCSLFLFLSAPVLKPKLSKWSLVSKLVHRGLVASCEDQRERVNELEHADVALSNMLMHNSSKEVYAGTARKQGISDGILQNKIESAETKLENLDATIESFENGLDCLFRRFINARVCLLNILSQ